MPYTSVHLHRLAPRIRVPLVGLLSMVSWIAVSLGVSPVPDEKPATFPSWWFQRDVITRIDIAVAAPVWPQDYRAATDFAVLNQGQLKAIATAAFDELEQNLPGGAGAELLGLIKNWHQLNPDGSFMLDAVTGKRIPLVSETTKDFAAVNLGQLKNVAKLFYDRLIVAGYTTSYPWSDSSIPANDFALANLGQTKKLFAFDVL